MTRLHWALLLGVLFSAPWAHAQTAARPNIVILWGDDVGYWNVSAYNQGMMGYRTPNIDRIAKEGALFTDSYGQPRQKVGSFSLDNVLKTLQQGGTD